jgi:hypothetical protein
MPCDERYRSWAMRRAPFPPPPDLCRAELVRVSGCPARSGFRELQFKAEGTAWSWCFPPAAEPYGGPEVRSLILRPGPHGLIAQAVTDAAGMPPGSIPLDLALAADLAMDAVPVFIDRRLTRQGRHDAAPLVRTQAAEAGARHQQGAG